MCTAARNKLCKAFVEVRNGSISDETKKLLLKLLNEEYEKLNTIIPNYEEEKQ